MWSSASIAAVALALLQGTDALNMAILRTLDTLGLEGSGPDGSLNRAIHSRSLQVQNASAEYIELPLDHFAHEKGQDSSHQAIFFNSPVFLYDQGSSDAGQNYYSVIFDNTSFFKQLVDDYNGIGIVWEHRFYGNSTSVPVNVNTSAEAFEFFNTEQALADVDSFAKQFSRKEINFTLTPDQTPWVFVGASYPGMRGAFMCELYPDTIYASWASSAPVQARVEMSSYFDAIWKGMNAKGFGNCSRDIQAAVRYMDNVMDTDQHGAVKLREQLLGLGAGNSTNSDFADVLGLPMLRWQSYGMEGSRTSLRRFCDYFETDPETNGTAPEEGWAASRGAKWAFEKWASNPNYVPTVNLLFGLECSGSLNTTGNCDLRGGATNPNSIGWAWQYCTQWGFYQTANLGPQQLISKYDNIEHQAYFCRKQFPDAPKSLLPDLPDVNRTNEIFGGWKIRPANTYWSNGEFDPWRSLSPASDDPYAPKGVKITQDIPKCGQKTSEDELFGMILKNAEHGFDFRTQESTGFTVPDTKVSQALFRKALDEWLPCFKPKERHGQS